MNTTAFVEGDLVARRDEAGFYVAKILKVDAFEMEGGGIWATYHMLMYAPIDLTSYSDLEHLQIETLHVPIDARGVDREWERIGTSTIVPEELRGYHTYLQMTNYGRYLVETGQNPEEVLGKAVSHYEEGVRLQDAGRHEDAIDQYSRAIELYPQYFEAIDNRALSKMDLGRYAEALNDLHYSMQLERDNSVSIFSAGECLLNLNRPEEAIPYFEECATRWPNKSLHHKLLRVARKRVKQRRGISATS